MNKCEYFVTPINGYGSSSALQRQLDSAGKDGWELVCYLDGNLVFKRIVEGISLIQQRKTDTIPAVV